MKPVLYLVRALPGGDLSPLRGIFEIRGGAPRPPPRERLVEEARDAAVLVPTYIDRVDAALVDALPALRHVASYGVGVNHLDLDACRRRGVLVTNTPGVLTDATADHAMALLLAAARRVVEADRIVRAGGWTEVDPAWMLGTEVTGKTVGVVGFGRIGQAFARRARGFDLRVLYASPRDAGVTWAERVSLDAAARAERLRLAARSAHLRHPEPPLPRSHRAPQAGRDRREHRARRGARRRRARRGARPKGGSALRAWTSSRTSRAYPRLTSGSRTSSSRRTSGRARARPGRPWRGWRSRTRRASGGASRRSTRCPEPRGKATVHGGRGAERAPSSAGRGLRRVVFTAAAPGCVHAPGTARANRAAPRRGGARVKRIVQALVGIAISGVALWLTLRGKDVSAIAQEIRAADYRYLAPYVLILLFIHLVRTVRWGILLEPVAKLPFSRLNAVSAVGFMALIVLPFRLGEFARPYLIAERPRLRVSSALSSVVVERVTDGLFTGVLLVVTLLAVPDGTPGVRVLRTGGVIVSLAFAALLAFLVLGYRNRALAVRLAEALLRPDLAQDGDTRGRDARRVHPRPAARAEPEQARALLPAHRRVLGRQRVGHRRCSPAASASTSTPWRPSRSWACSSWGS